MVEAIAPGAVISHVVRRQFGSQLVLGMASASIIWVVGAPADDPRVLPERLDGAGCNGTHGMGHLDLIVGGNITLRISGKLDAPTLNAPNADLAAQVRMLLTQNLASWTE